MSRVVVNNSVTLDGVMQAPGRPDEDLLNAATVDDLDVASSTYDMRGWAALADARFADAAASWMSNAEMSVLNAPYVLPRVGHTAILAGDAMTARLALDRLDATGAHGRALDLDRAAIGAGIAALEERRGEAVAGYRSAIAGWRDLGLPWDEALTSIEFVRVVGPDEPEAMAAADSARAILEGLGAARVLAILDASIEVGRTRGSSATPATPGARAAEAAETARPA